MFKKDPYYLLEEELDEAIAKQDIETVTRLLQKSNFTHPFFHELKERPLVMACLQNYTKAVQFILEKSENSLLSEWSSDLSPFYLSRSNNKVMEILLHHAKQICRHLLDSNKIPSKSELSLIIEINFSFTYLYLSKVKIDNDEANRYTSYLKNIEQKLTDKDKISFYVNFGDIFKRELFLVRAVQLYQSAYNICKLLPDSNQDQAFIMLKLGQCLKVMKKSEEAEKILKQAFLICKNDNVVAKASISLAIAECMFLDNNHRLTLSFFLAAEKIFTKSSYSGIHKGILLCKSWQFYYEDDLEKAIEESDKVIECSSSSTFEYRNAKLLLSILHYLKNNLKLSQRYYQELPKSYFQYLRNQLNLSTHADQRNNSSLIRRFESVRDRLITIVAKEDFFGLTVSISEYVLLFKTIVENFCLPENQNECQKSWQIYCDIIELVLRQTKNDIQKLYTKCPVSKRLVYDGLPPLIEAVIEHMFQFCLFVIGRPIYEIVKLSPDIQNHSHKIILRNGNYITVVALTTVYKSEVNKNKMHYMLSPELAKQNLMQSLTVIKIFFISTLFSIDTNNIKYNIEKEKELKIEDCENIISSIRINFLSINFCNAVTIDFEYEKNLIQVVDFYLHALLFIYFRLSIKVLKNIQNHQVHSIFDRLCFLFQNFLPSINDYTPSWINAFVINEHILQAVVDFFYKIIGLAASGQGDILYNFDQLYQNLNERVEKAYHDLELLTLNDYVRELKKANIDFDYDVNFDALTLIFKNEKIARKFGILLKECDFDYEQESHTIFHLKKFRSEKKFKKFMTSLARQYNPEVKTLPEIMEYQRPNHPICADINNNNSKTEDITPKNPRPEYQKNKETKNDKQTKKIRARLADKKLLKKAEVNISKIDQNKNQNIKEDEKKNEEEIKTDSSTADSKLEATPAFDKPIEVIVNDSMPKWFLNDIKTDTIAKAWNTTSSPEDYDKKLLHLALKHLNELKEILTSSKQNKFTQETILHNVLLYSILVFNAINDCSTFTKFSKYIKPFQASKFRNILLHRFNSILQEEASCRLFFSEEEESLTYLLINEIHSKLTIFLSNGDFSFNPLDLSQHPLYKIFINDGKLITNKQNDIVMENSKIISTELDAIDYLFQNIKPTQDDLTKYQINEIKMRLIKIGEMAKELKNKNSYFCITEFSSNLKLGNYSPTIYEFISADEESYNQFITDIETKHSTPLLNYLNSLSHEEEKQLLSLLEFHDFLKLCIEIRNTVTHNFSGAKFTRENYDSDEKRLNSLIYWVASLARSIRNERKIITDQSDINRLCSLSFKLSMQ